MFAARGYPKPDLVLNEAKKHRRRGGFVTEHPRIPLISNGPTSEHGEGCHCLAVRDIIT
jgi:CO dehydrogenase nickel-insertion accessory protein CooC1